MVGEAAAAKMVLKAAAERTAAAKAALEAALMADKAAAAGAEDAADAASEKGGEGKLAQQAWGDSSREASEVSEEDEEGLPPAQ